MAYPKNIVECILKLFPDAEVDEDFVCTDRGNGLGDTGLEISKWNLRGFQTDTKPTEAELNAVADEVQTEYDAQEYARNRKAEYDALNQFELMTDDAANGTTTHADAINAIKAKYPKG